MEAVAEHRLAVSALPDPEAEGAIARFTDAFVADANATWWWEHLSVPSESLFCNWRPELIPTCLRELIGESSAPVLVIVGDGDGRDVLRGRADAVVTAVEESPPC